MVIGDLDNAGTVSEYRHPEWRVECGRWIGTEDPPSEKRIADQVARRSERFAAQAQQCSLIDAS